MFVPQTVNRHYLCKLKPAISGVGQPNQYAKAIDPALTALIITTIFMQATGDSFFFVTKHPPKTVPVAAIRTVVAPKQRKRPDIA